MPVYQRESLCCCQKSYDRPAMSEKEQIILYCHVFIQNNFIYVIIHVEGNDTLLMISTVSLLWWNVFTFFRSWTNINNKAYIFLKETVVPRMLNVLDGFIELYGGAISQLALCGTVTSLRLSCVYWWRERRERRDKRNEEWKENYCYSFCMSVLKIFLCTN